MSRSMALLQNTVQFYLNTIHFKENDSVYFKIDVENNLQNKQHECILFNCLYSSIQRPKNKDRKYFAKNNLFGFLTSFSKASFSLIYISISDDFGNIFLIVASQRTTGLFFSNTLKIQDPTFWIINITNQSRFWLVLNRPLASWKCINSRNKLLGIVHKNYLVLIAEWSSI